MSQHTNPIFLAFFQCGQMDPLRSDQPARSTFTPLLIVAPPGHPGERCCYFYTGSRLHVLYHHGHIQMRVICNWGHALLATACTVQQRPCQNLTERDGTVTACHRPPC